LEKLNGNSFTISKDLNTYSLDLINDVEINFNKNYSGTLNLLVNVKDNKKINIILNENSNVKIIVITFGEFSYTLNIDIKDDSYLDLYTADYISKDASINKVINLKGINSSYKGYEYLACINNKLNGNFIVNHLNKSTSANGKFIYLVNKDGYINRNVESVITKGMIDSNSSENIKGVILDKTSRIDAKPVLKIDFDDVHATHGCAIGTIDSNEIYYLMSRGLTKDDALRIICKSLINPIYREIKDEEFLNATKEILDKTIGE